MEDKNLKMLEFHRVREIIAGYTSFPASRKLALDLTCSTDFERITLLLKQSAEAQGLLYQEREFSIGEIVDSRNDVRMAARGRILEPMLLVDIGQTLGTVRRLRDRLSKLSEEFQLLWDIARDITPLQQIETNISRCLTAEGEVPDTASPQLSAIRRQSRTTRQQLLEHLEAIIGSPRGRRIAQEPIITEREGRYVIPIKVEARREIRGIVHDVSNTGATVFIEPWSTMERGNELRELVVKEQQEIERILRELSTEVGTYEREICNNIALTADIDLILAKARYARQTKATEATLTPCINGYTDTKSNNRLLRLVNARHPLLGDKAVPLSVEIGSDYSILVITGPNTGGKTVALKTIGLLSLMTQAGLPIPASEDSILPVFDGVFVDTGDEQSIEQTVSTFSWHMGNIVRIIKGTTRNSLVLLDELGSSTDPAQGSALARAILRYFLTKGAMAVVTTHYGELKAFAHTTPGLQNASFEFDPVTLAPTYHLTVGTPGGSNALATAARLGLPPDIIENARGMLSQGTQELESLLTDLMQEKEQVQSLYNELENEKHRLIKQTEEITSRLQRIREEEKKIVQEARDTIVRESADLQREIRQAASQLRKQRTKETLDQSRRTLTSVREQIKEPHWQPKTDDTEDRTATSISPGDTVWLKDSNIPAKVLSVSKKAQQIEVQAGPTRIRLGIDGVARVTHSPVKDTGQLTPVITTERSRAVSPDIYLRGKRADEVEWLLNNYIDDAAMAGLSEIRIVHGSGTGTLREIVREMLPHHPLVKSFRPGGRGEGGNGVTIAQL